MKTKLILAALATMVLAACDDNSRAKLSDQEVREFNASTDKLLAETRTMFDDFDIKSVDRAASTYLSAVQLASFSYQSEANARDALAAQLTPGGASLKQMDYSAAKETAEKARKSVADARKTLEDAEDKLRSKGFTWEESTYSVVIGNYALEVDQKRRAHRLARTSDERTRLHREWLDFLKVTLDQIKSGEY